MLSDIEIAQAAHPRPIQEVAQDCGLLENELELYGRYKAKVCLQALDRLACEPDGKLVLVTAITPTPAGEGKTTTTVGLGQALWKKGIKATVAIREPSLGPVFGIKGGAAGGGYAQVVPMDDINLHFTGDIHAVGTAHNLLSAILDNHLHFGNALGIDTRTITWKRVLDMNDRALRQTVIGLGGRANGVPREDGFEITVASEVMAILCLSESPKDLKERLARIVVANRNDGTPVTALDLGAAGAMTLALKDALKPNLVQTLEGTPAFVHGGPFANIAHGCNSVMATRLALKCSEIVITEAGFGADLGAEKFFDIKCRSAKLQPDAAVLVATIRALKMHGGVKKEETSTENLAALEKGLANLDAHASNIRAFGVPFVIALNRFETDTDAELDMVRKHCEKQKLTVALSTVWADGGLGGMVLADALLPLLKRGSDFKYLYDVGEPIKTKIEKVAKTIYGAGSVVFLPDAEKRIKELQDQGFADLPICMAKTPLSLTDDPKLFGAPKGYTLTVRDLKVSAGAGFLVAYAGNIMTMPGLPRKPAAENMDLADDGTITGLF